MRGGVGYLAPDASYEGGALKHTKSGFQAASAPERRRATSGGALLSVAVVCEDEIGRRRLAAILERGGFDLTFRAGSLADLPTAPAPDALVVAFGGTGSARADALAALRERWPHARVVGTAVDVTPRAIRDALAEGADGFVLDGQLEDALAPAVRAVCSGQLVLPRELKSQVARPTLSAREKQVLSLVVLGFSNAEIARKLHLVESTVKSHLSSIFAKLGVRSRNEAAELVLDRERGFGTGILAISGGEG